MGGQVSGHENKVADCAGKHKQCKALLDEPIYGSCVFGGSLLLGKSNLQGKGF